MVVAAVVLETVVAVAAPAGAGIAVAIEIAPAGHSIPPNHWDPLSCSADDGR